MSRKSQFASQLVAIVVKVAGAELIKIRATTSQVMGLKTFIHFSLNYILALKYCP